MRTSLFGPRTLLLTIGIAGIGGLVVFNPYGKSVSNRCMAVGLIIAALAPAWRWIGNRYQDRVPVLAIVGGFYALCFGLAGLVTPDIFIGRISVTEAEYSPALFAAIMSWACVWTGFRLATRWRWFRPPIGLRRDDAPFHGVAFMMYPVLLVLDQLASRVFPLLIQVTHALVVFFFLWALHAAMTHRYEARKRTFVIFVYLPLHVLLYLGLSDGHLVGLLVSLQLVGLTYAAAKNKLPLTAILLITGMFLLLQPAKGQYRTEIWRRGENLSYFDGAVRFVELGLSSYSGGVASVADRINEAYSRINHLQTTAAVIADTPTIRPFQNGVTYLPLFTKWIPRAIWPNKPREDFGNQWAREYGYLSPRDFGTSYNLPWLTEMYMNYGWAGVVTLSFLVGLVAAGIWATFARGAVSPPQFAAAVLFSSSFFFPESNLSIALGNLIISMIVILLFVQVLSSLRMTGERRPEIHAPSVAPAGHVMNQQ
jgi:hypothetical protein